MKRAVMLLAAGVALALPAAPAQAACAAGPFRYAGTSYFPTGVPVVADRALAGAVMPGCRDLVVTGPGGEDLSPPVVDVPIDARRIAGVPTAVAVAFAGRAHLADGYLAWDDGPRPDLRACGRPWRLRGIATGTTANGRAVLVRNRVVAVRGARVTRLTRHGYAYVGAGQAIRATVRSCRNGLVALAISRS